MLKKIILTILLALGFIVLGIWSPWQRWDFSITSLLGIEDKEEFSALKVKSLAGEIDIFVDGEYRDTVSPEMDLLEIFPIKPGEHTIRLARRSEAEYTEIVRKINFEPSVDVIIGYEIGPSEHFSEGHILYARRNFAAEGNPRAEIFSIPENVNVLIDGQPAGETPLRDIELTVDSKHKLRFEKEGYDSLEIEIFPENQNERDKLMNTVLTLEINLFLRPINITEQ